MLHYMISKYHGGFIPEPNSFHFAEYVFRFPLVRCRSLRFAVFLVLVTVLFSTLTFPMQRVGVLGFCMCGYSREL